MGDITATNDIGGPLASDDGLTLKPGDVSGNIHMVNIAACVQLIPHLDESSRDAFEEAVNRVGCISGIKVTSDNPHAINSPAAPYSIRFKCVEIRILRPPVNSSTVIFEVYVIKNEIVAIMGYGSGSGAHRKVASVSGLVIPVLNQAVPDHNMVGSICNR
jgi:hypothetical protein